ncbi:MAG: hypothetical protein COU33_02640 [Candidatus Magasanikbacteria bacterium CG10_big_fil_rev_8_21_14_0_10_43_6]|uniref:Uncharacterized protein n=1 Tax=Candidatus Magasanikbacteria bacterium CG10_big_fil_rev_8_21_14_0_10_43_6 TaxID=1974650 RepID=A0A2M6W1C3_9BACT|nr:MAG: hypothetical protein COU33_02640 [Candidatus Magasanikbacteria bacterium CG10_big_fil_rev_8_21_14_0_10_43_6]
MTNKAKGSLLVIMGLGLIPFSLIAWSVARFTISQTAASPTYTTHITTDSTITPLGAPTITTTIVSTINIVLSLLPIIGLFVLTPIGIVLMIKKDTHGHPAQPNQQQ